MWGHNWGWNQSLSFNLAYGKAVSDWRQPFQTSSGHHHQTKLTVRSKNGLFQISTRTTIFSATENRTTSGGRNFLRQRRSGDRPEPNLTSPSLSPSPRASSAMFRIFCPISSRWLGPGTGTCTTSGLGRSSEPRILRPKSFRSKSSKSLRRSSH